MHKWCPASSSILVVLCLSVGVASYASLMEVVGRVCRVYYPWNTLREDIAIGILSVVFLPVYAVRIL